ncbi:SAM-dependent methyltransferase [Streptomyces sp. CB01635]|uniref:class I SAM-dependent methyltransferase n=1 Tax=unclassified Streptomyces TaxID=2593676 RepID=UPI000C276D1F|nr:class I SAM-dependent methyltransferase [Streptomyces sp. CB01635]PJN07126.1 SAM-dependent methyltransferase [Streptomyces sp. CB01635]
MTTASRAHSFNIAAAQYAANRPSYPPALLDAVEEAAGRPLAGARVADVGAGTGISTALLHARGARVVAVEPGDGMALEFRQTLPAVPIVRGDGNALPLADASLDLLTYAQSWHWTEPARSAPEAMRVLRPGGALALWWNTVALDIPWIAAQHERIARHVGVETGARQRPDEARATELSGLTALPGRGEVTLRHVRWSRHVPLDTHLANIGSHSAFLVLEEGDAQAFLTEERARVGELFPDGTVEETYVVELLVAIRT